MIIIIYYTILEQYITYIPIFFFNIVNIVLFPVSTCKMSLFFYIYSKLVSYKFIHFFIILLNVID